MEAGATEISRNHDLRLLTRGATPPPTHAAALFLQERKR